jgi:hypothetical protein
MASQFEKRKAKASVDSAPTVEQQVETETTAPIYTQIGLDVYSPDGGRNYEVAEISYNHETRQAEVKEVYKISRLVALQYANTKTALNTLKRKLIVKGK